MFFLLKHSMIIMAFAFKLERRPTLSSMSVTTQAYGHARMHRIVPSSGGQPLSGGRGQRRSTPDPWMPARVSVSSVACCIAKDMCLNAHSPLKCAVCSLQLQPL